MFLPISRGWQGFTDFLPLLWHPDMFLLTLPSLPVFLVGGEGISFGSFLGVASPSARLSHPADLSLLSRRAVLLEKPFLQPHNPTAFIFFGIIMNCELIWALDAVQAVAWWTPTLWCWIFPQEFMFPLNHSACIFVQPQDAPAARQLCCGSAQCVQQARGILGQRKSDFFFPQPLWGFSPLLRGWDLIIWVF